MKSSYAVLLTALLTLLAAEASTHNGTEYDAFYSKCLNDSGPISNAVVESCTETVSQKAKAEIASRYKSIHALLSSESLEDAERFEASQKAWLQYRNIHCDLAGSYIGSPSYGFCLMQLDTSRAIELRELDGE